MSITGIGAVPPVKIEGDTSIKSSESARPANKLVERNLAKPDGADQRIESRIAALKQQVSATTDTSQGPNSIPPRRPKMANDLSFALTQLGINDQSSSNNQETPNQDGPDPNRQSRATSVQPVDPSIQKTPVQF